MVDPAQVAHSSAIQPGRNIANVVYEVLYHVSFFIDETLSGLALSRIRIDCSIPSRPAVDEDISKGFPSS